MGRFLLFSASLSGSTAAYLWVSQALGFGLTAFALIFLIGLGFKVAAHILTLEALKSRGSSAEGNPVMRRVFSVSPGEASFAIALVFPLVFISGLLLIMHGFPPEPVTVGAAVMSSMSTAEAVHNFSAVRRGQSDRVATAESGEAGKP